MSREDIQKLLGGYATGTLTPEEQKILFEAALEDQELFESLAREQAVRDLLRDPAARAHLLATLDTPAAPWYRRWLRPIPVAALSATAFAAIMLVRHFTAVPAPGTIAQLIPPPPPAVPAEASAAKESRSAGKETTAAPAEPAVSSLPTGRRERVQTQALAPAVSPPAAAPVTAPAPPATAPPAAPKRKVSGAAEPSSFGVIGGAAASVADGAMRKAEISGSVKDAAGAAVSNAQITARDLNSGTLLTVNGAVNGEFNVPAVQPGQYRLEISSPGFQTSFRDVDLTRNDRATVDATLQVGTAHEAVSVQATAAAPLVQQFKSQQLDSKALPMLDRMQPPNQAPQPTLQYAILIRDSGGAFVDAGPSPTFRPRTTFKIRVISTAAGTLEIQEATSNGGWRQVLAESVEAGKPVESKPLVYNSAGERQFRVELVSPAQSGLQQALKKSAMGQVQGVPKTQQRQAPQPQGQQSQAAVEAKQDIAPPAAIIITVNIR